MAVDWTQVLADAEAAYAEIVSTQRPVQITVDGDSVVFATAADVLQQIETAQAFVERDSAGGSRVSHGEYDG